jgi:hypothetical protein
MGSRQSTMTASQARKKNDGSASRHHRACRATVVLHRAQEKASDLEGYLTAAETRRLHAEASTGRQGGPVVTAGRY